MTNEELDNARVREAQTIARLTGEDHAVVAACLAREGWTPPKPVDPDLLAARVLFKKMYTATPYDKLTNGVWDRHESICAFLAGAAHARKAPRSFTDDQVERAARVRWAGPTWKRLSASGRKEQIDAMRAALDALEAPE